MAQAVGIVAILVAAADLVDALPEQVVLEMGDMGDIAGVPGINHGGIDALGQADLAIDAAQQHRPKVGLQAHAGKISADGVAWNGCKSQLFWRRNHVGQGTVGVDDCVF
ncbi:MAG: hypothetical protein GZ085_08420 [Sulfuriferula multivorans]|uniref:Uncharacterized protein n=1 Tax=Sulfuriferula multivorans TaxID=1559896 RepID=A0A7C9JY08_9PROT|nr:hypothetical protein [Sulfuriferula multivorans]